MVDSFAVRYDNLEKEFKAQVKRDCKNKIPSVYLPNIRPSGPVGFIFIGMEPSMGRWTKNSKTSSQRMKAAEEQIVCGFKNFSYSAEDFILHHCIREYLCSDVTNTYYITDLSKGAMLTDEAGRGRKKRWESWYPLLLDEVALVSTQKTKVITIGKSAYEFLDKNDFERKSGRKLFHIPHYSNRAAGRRNKKIEQPAFKAFKENVSLAGITALANMLTKQWDIPNDLISKRLRLPNSKELSDSSQKLVFTYKNCFEEIRKSL